MYPNSLPILKIRLFVFYWVVGVLYIFWIKVHYQIHDLQIFSPILWVECLFTFLKFLILMKFSLFFLLFVLWCCKTFCFCFFSFLFFWPRRVACRILVPRLGIKPMPLHWKRGVLTTGLPGNSHKNIFKQYKLGNFITKIS